MTELGSGLWGMRKSEFLQQGTKLVALKMVLSSCLLSLG